MKIMKKMSFEFLAVLSCAVAYADNPTTIVLEGNLEIRDDSSTEGVTEGKLLVGNGVTITGETNYYTTEATLTHKNLSMWSKWPWNSCSVGEFSVSIGDEFVDSSDFGFAMGRQVNAKYRSFAFGYQCYAGGSESFAFGTGSMTYGSNCFSFGIDNYAYGNYSFTFGDYHNYSNGNWSFTFGNSNHSNGDYSFAFGNDLESDSFHQVTFGRYGEYINGGFSKKTWVPTEPLFVLANGASESDRSNAMVVFKNGDTNVNGNLKAKTIAVENASGGIPMGAFGRQ